MAPRETRSPSPAGSSYSSRRHDRYDRHQRDRGHRDKLSRSRSTERRRDRDRDRERDRDRDRDRENDRYRRRDRSRDQYKDSYRSGRRDRERSRSPRGGRHRRSRERDYHERRDNSRDNEHIKHTDSADTKRRDQKQSREPPSNSQPATAHLNDEEKKKAERLAKLEAWKAKQAAEKEKKIKESKSVIQSLDVKGTLSPTSVTSSGANSPTISYQGKFDPKEVVKKATINHAAKATLGNDIAIPTAELPNTSNSTVTNGSSTRSGLNPGRPVKLKASGNMNRFGLGSKSQDVDKKKGLDFDDDEATERKLEKLPTPPFDDAQNDVAQANIDEDDDDVDMDEVNNEEDVFAAARAAAAEKRAQNAELDTQMVDAPSTEVGMEAEIKPKQEEQKEQDQDQDQDLGEEEKEEDVDPLDAFMANLDSKPTLKRKALSSAKNSKTQPEAMFGDEAEGAAEDMETIDTPDDILAMAIKKKKRDIPSVDHSKVQYEPFRKNFYSEPIDMIDMTEEEVVNLRLELDGIKVRGLDVPKPVTKWAQCGLGVQVLDVIRSLGYEKPTSIQSQAVPAIMSGRDVIGVAKTGSGKTIAFLLPMFRHIKDQRPLDSLDGPIALVMSPTRELATQIHRECKPFLKALNLKAVCAYGGAPIKDQIADLKRGAEIIVCTPGRMIELLSANSGRVTNLRRITYIVLDEADRMFDMGFEPQVMKIIGNIRPTKQTVLFSATFPRNMEALARKTLGKPIEIIVGGRSVVAPEITQIVEVRPENTKFVRLLEVLGELYDRDEDARTLVFVDRQDSADGLLRELMRKGYPCNSIHGGKDQVDRDSTIDDFKAGVIPIMIATSVAARGLDVKQLRLVVNYDTPNHLEDYVHRAGRTGRAGNTGTAITFITEEQDRYAVDIVKALKQSEAPIPEDLQKLANGFLEKIKSGKAKASATGFGGKGLEKLDQERDAARTRERKAFGAGDDNNAEEEKEESKEDEEIVIKASAITSTATNTMTSAFAHALNEDNIVVRKSEVAPSKSSSNQAGSGNKLDAVNSAAASINDRLNKRNQLNPGHPIDNKGPDAGAFHATLEINDFPQRARWAVTNRTNVAKIIDSTGTSITTKGNFYAAGKDPGPNDAPKLYILVEGDTELAVTNAMKEMMRLLKEGTIQAADQESRAPTGRYNVV